MNGNKNDVLKNVLARLGTTIGAAAIGFLAGGAHMRYLNHHTMGEDWTGLIELIFLVPAVIVVAAVLSALLVTTKAGKWAMWTMLAAVFFEIGLVFG